MVTAVLFTHIYKDNPQRLWLLCEYGAAKLKDGSCKCEMCKRLVAMMLTIQQWMVIKNDISNVIVMDDDNNDNEEC